MNAQQLRNSILQEAIEGRLVPQDPNDEPASVLLDKIHKEKAKLVKEGKLKKKDLEEIPISEDEKPFEIPESWAWCRLINLCKIIHYGHTASAAPTGNSKLLRITDIQDDKVNWSSVPFCSIKEKDLETYQLHNRDILIARTGGTIGKTYIVRELNDIAVFASYLIRAIPLDNIFEEYIKLFMGSPYYWSQLTDAATGTGQPNVNGQSLSKLIVPLPPLAEQKRIVAKIEELLPKVEEYGKAQDALNKLNEELPERLKKSILQEAITGRLVPQDPNDEPASVLLDKIRAEKKQLFKEGKLKKKDLEEIPIFEDEKPFKIPESWEWVRLADYLDVRDGTHDSPKYHSEGIPFVTSKNLDKGNIDFSTCKCISLEDHKKFSERSYVENGDILFAMIGSIGNPVIVKKDREFSIKNVALFKRYCVELTNIYYIYYYLLYIQNELKKISSGGVQSFVGLKTFREWVFPLPPLAEQKRIVAKIEELFSVLDSIKESLE